MTKQAPIPSGFGPTTTGADVLRGIDLHGKVAVITGGYSGLGLESARALRAAGAEVIVPTRDVPRAREALRAVPGVRVEAMDLLDPSSIDAFARRLEGPVHILINSAGIMANPLTRDARGFESQLATNHLGHFQLTSRLLPALRAARGARVVSVSSRGHRFSDFVFDDPHFERRAYDPWLGYGQSKTANVLFAVELDRRERGHGVRAFSLHPGAIAGTSLAKYLTIEQLKAAKILDEDGNPIRDPARDLKTIPQGAATQLWCAVSPQLEAYGGEYCEDADIAALATEMSTLSLATSGGLKGVLPYAVDPESAARLWTWSERVLGLQR